MIGLGSRAWPTVQKNNRNAGRIAGLLDINRMHTAGFEEKTVVGQNFRVKSFHGQQHLKLICFPEKTGKTLFYLEPLPNTSF
jgi:hypothetical protein